jgi:hypothetical protein
VLCTHSLSHPGYPFGSLAPYCLDRQGLPLLLLSHLAQHTRNLARDSRCGLLLTTAGSGDPQQQARLSVVADVRPLEPGQAGGIERFFRYFPHTRPYFEDLGFRFFRLLPRACHLNAGFAAARWLGPDRVVQANLLDAGQEQELVAALDARPELITRRLGDRARAARGPMGVVGADGHGIDLHLGHELTRLALPEAAGSPQSVLDMLARG